MNVSFVGTATDIDITEHDWYDGVIRGSTTNLLSHQEQMDSVHVRLQMLRRVI